MGLEVIHGDAPAEVARLRDASVDAIVTDPPYEIGFMGKGWDRTGIAYSVPLWRDCRRVLRPGGWLLAFGGTRTSHRLACAVEDAGFELRDTITWLYGSGFPKGKGCLKPAGEPIIVARRAAPRPWLNIDATRVESPILDSDRRTSPRPPGGGADRVYAGGWALTRTGERHNPSGRWPANVVFSHAPCCGEQCADGCPVAELDAQSGDRPSTGRPGRPARATTYSDTGGYGGALGLGVQGPLYDDEGGASRFFPTFRYQAKAPTRERPKVDGVAHPTVKPLALMRWLVRLVTPPGGLVLDPFAGTGTTGEACALEGLSAVLIENDARYLPHIALRLQRVG